MKENGLNQARMTKEFVRIVDICWLVPFKSIINVIENKPHREPKAISGRLIALYEK